MTATTLTFNRKTHVYRDGRRHLPSVTSVIKGVEDQSGLFGWYARMAARRAVENPALLSRTFRLQGPDAAIEWLAKAAEDYRDAAGLSGSDLHDLADRLGNGLPFPDHLDRDVAAMLDHVRQFYEDFGVATVASEVRLANRAIGYAGTTDGLLQIDQYGCLPLVCDWKTSASGYRRPEWSHGKHAMQLAPYSRAEVTFNTAAKTEHPMPGVNQDVGLIVFIRPEGYKMYEFDLAPAWPQFVRAVENYCWWKGAKTLGRRVELPAAA